MSGFDLEREVIIRYDVMSSSARLDWYTTEKNAQHKAQELNDRHGKGFAWVVPVIRQKKTAYGRVCNFLSKIGGNK